MDLVKWHPNERVDKVDLDFLNNEVVDEFSRFGSHFLTDEETPVVTQGWETSEEAGDVLRVSRGGGINLGQLLSEGAAYYDVPFASLGADVYGVWIRFTRTDGTDANRAFFNPPTNSQRVRMVQTRQVAGWEARASVDSPGSEWQQVAEVDWDGVSLATSTITDKRNFVYEGPSTGLTWGTGDDRDPDRGTNGVKTLHRFAQAVLQKITELQSDSDDWWDETVEPLDEKVSRNGDLTLVGDYLIDGDLEIYNVLIAPTINTGTIDVATLATFTTEAEFLGLTRLSRSTAGSTPDPDASGAKLVLENTVTAASYPTYSPPVFFLHGDTEGAPSRDGFAVWSERLGGGNFDVELYIGYLTNSGAASPIVTIRDVDPLLDIGDAHIKAANVAAAVAILNVTGAGVITVVSSYGLDVGDPVDMDDDTVGRFYINYPTPGFPSNNYIAAATAHSASYVGLRCEAFRQTFTPTETRTYFRILDEAGDPMDVSALGAISIDICIEVKQAQ